MQTVLVTGSDTGVGKTHVVGVLARVFGTGGKRVQIVKPVETGRRDGEPGDATAAADAAGNGAQAITLESFSSALAPTSAAALDGKTISAESLAAAVRRLGECDWRIVEGAGGIASPIDAESRDWSFFAKAIGATAVVIVVPDRVGAIGQARMAYDRAEISGSPAGIWLNSSGSVDRAIHESNVAGIRAAGLPLWGQKELEDVCRAAAHSTPLRALSLAERACGRRAEDGRRPQADALQFPRDRAAAFLSDRELHGIRRVLRVTAPAKGVLNLADNDYLELARDPALAQAVADAARNEGTSASASALVTGWRESHERLIGALAQWHGIPYGLIWSSGYAANSAVLGVLPVRGDLVLADRLIHHSMIAGILKSGARLQRYDHLRLDELESYLEKAKDRAVFVATESLFSMDGDYPDLGRMAELKRKHRFFWVVDEAHAVGWYGPEGAGLVRAAGVEKEVDVLVGTLGKALGSGGAYTLCNDELIRDQLVNAAGEFIYSTALPPTAVAAAAAAIERARALASGQSQWHEASRNFRSQLRQQGWAAAEGDSPIVPVIVGAADVTTRLADRLRENGILAGAVRPPTVPAGSSRLRFSLKRSFTAADGRRVLDAMGGGPGK